MYYTQHTKSADSGSWNVLVSHAYICEKKIGADKVRSKSTSFSRTDNLIYKVIVSQRDYVTS